MDEHQYQPKQAESSQPEASHEDDKRNEEVGKEDRFAIATNSPVIAEGLGQRDEWRQHPYDTLVTETGGVDQPLAAHLLPSPKPTSPAERKDHDRNKRDASPKQRSPWRNLLVTAGVALVAGMIGAGVVTYFVDSSKSKGKQSASDGQEGSQQKSKSNSESKSKGSGKEADKGAGADETALSGSSIPGMTLADDSDSLRRQIEHLSERIDQLGHRMDTTSRHRDEVPPDLRTLQIKVGDLSRMMEDVGDMPSRLRRLDNRLELFQQELKTLRDRISTLRDKELTADSPDRKLAKEILDSPSQTPASSIPTIEARPDFAMAQGVALFKDGNYPEASNIFRKLQITRPDDARVWYYSALAVGLTTGDWTQSTRELVAHGLQCERAGMPEKNKIDAAFSGLTDAQGRKWLKSYREQVSPSR